MHDQCGSDCTALTHGRRMRTRSLEGPRYRNTVWPLSHFATDALCRSRSSARRMEIVPSILYGRQRDASALTILLLLLESWPQCVTWNLQAMDINTDVLATNVGKQHDVHSALHRFMQARPRGKIQQEGEQQKAPLSFVRFERRCHAPRKLTQKLRSHACCATLG